MATYRVQIFNGAGMRLQSEVVVVDSVTVNRYEDWLVVTAGTFNATVYKGASIVTSHEAKPDGE